MSAVEERWERFAGDTGAFGLRMTLEPDPDGGRYIDPEVGLSWGSFQIWAGGKNLCAHQEGEVRVDSVHWYLLPLLEWFTRYWNPLLHEERLPVKNAGGAAWESLWETRFPPPAVEVDEQRASDWERTWQEWWTRHALHAASEGGLFPDVVFRRYRDLVEVSWGPTRTVGMPPYYEFTESAPGVSRLSPLAVAEPLHEVLSSAADHLRSLAPKSKRMGALRKGLRSLSASSASREQRLMWLAGSGTNESTIRSGWERVTKHLSGFAEAPRRAIRAMLDVSESPLVVTGSCQAALMFGSLAPDVKEADVLSLAGIMAGLYSRKGDSDVIRNIRRDIRVEESWQRAWDQGYELAEEVHKRFLDGIRDDTSVRIERLLETLDVKVEELSLSDENVCGVSIAGPEHRPGIVVNMNHGKNAHPFGYRFTLAHEVCHLLFDRDVGCRLAIASGPWAPQDVEQRANAFAAMLLMPFPLVQQAVNRLTVDVATVEGVEEVARQLEVGRLAMLNHLKNQGFIDETERRRIEDRFLSSVDE